MRVWVEKMRIGVKAYQCCATVLFQHQFSNKVGFSLSIELHPFENDQKQINFNSKKKKKIMYNLMTYQMW